MRRAVKKGQSSLPLFGPCLLWQNGRPSQLLLSTCKNLSQLQCGPMPNVMAALGIQVAPSVENDEERKFHNSIPCTMPQSLADVVTPSALYSAVQ